ncbi:MAG: hypothetical protein ACJA0T_000349 [Colwellia sp.]|jgi:uncharacterized protein
MNRLLEVCTPCNEQMQVNVNFDVDDLGLNVISGTGSVSVALICQRCTEPLIIDLDVEFTLSPAKDDEAAEALPSYYDAIELDENGEVNLLELVEEELLLAIPLIAMHEPSQCQASVDSVWGELPEELEKPNPFDILQKFK